MCIRDSPSIVPYQTVKAKDGLMVLAIANDRQFKEFCEYAKISNLINDPKFKTNSSRVKNRSDLNKIINKIIKKKTIKQWVEGLVKVNVPCGPINNIQQVFEDKQVKSNTKKSTESLIEGITGAVDKTTPVEDQKGSIRVFDHTSKGSGKGDGGSTIGKGVSDEVPFVSPERGVSPNEVFQRSSNW